MESDRLAVALQYTAERGIALKTDIIDLVKKHPDFSSLYWVIGCMSKHKDEKRDHIIHIQVKNDSFTATDGNRLHHYQSEYDYEDGFYEVIQKTKSRIFLKSNGNDKRYPKFEDILEPAKVEPFTIFKHSGNCFWAYSEIIRKFEEIILNYDFLCDLLSTGEAFDCYIRDDTAPLVFICNSKKAALMPMR